MSPVTVALSGVPVPKGRPRFVRGRNAYTPAATRRFERDFAWAAKMEMGARKPFAGAIKITALFEIEIPQSWPECKRTAATIGAILPTGKPDLDNYLKGAIDACNAIVFSDDAQIIEISARKIYGIAPKTVISVFPILDAP